MCTPGGLCVSISFGARTDRGWTPASALQPCAVRGGFSDVTPKPRGPRGGRTIGGGGAAGRPRPSSDACFLLPLSRLAPVYGIIPAVARGATADTFQALAPTSASVSRRLALEPGMMPRAGAARRRRGQRTASPIDFVEPARPPRPAGEPAAVPEFVLTAGYRERLGQDRGVPGLHGLLYQERKGARALFAPPS